MKKLESSLTNMVLVLVGVALIVGTLLSFVNNATSPAIEKQKEKALSDGIKSVMGVEELTVTGSEQKVMEFDGKECNFVVHKAVDKSGKELGVAVESVTVGFGGDLKVLVGFNPEGVILGYTLLEAQETPGLGAKADKWFQKDGKSSIIGKSLSADKLLKVTKDEGEVDAITASTITSRAFLKAVNQAYLSLSGNSSDGTTSATVQKKESEQETPTLN